MQIGPLMLDIEGVSLSASDKNLLREPSVGGVILFSRNYDSPSQIADLVAEIRATRQRPMLIGVDHEGGRVQRFQEGFSQIPAMRDIGRLYDVNAEHAVTTAQSCGWLIGAELRSVDIDLCFAPCLDLDWGVSEVIGRRSFHSDSDVVATLASAFCCGLREAGMAAVAKHFPGHGAVAADSHLKLPVDTRSLELISIDIHPFEQLIQRRDVAAIMMAHVIYEDLDAMTAGFSNYWISEQLRERIGFDGIIFSDDLTMQATASFGSVPERAELALKAGCDMVMVCNDRPAAEATVTKLNSYADSLSASRLLQLRGDNGPSYDALRDSDRWQRTTSALDRWVNQGLLDFKP